MNEGIKLSQIDRRSKKAILVSVEERQGTPWLCLDDLQSDGASDACTWRKAAHFTAKPISGGLLEDINWTEKELADFGYHILARLHAFYKLHEL